VAGVDFGYQGFPFMVDGRLKRRKRIATKGKNNKGFLLSKAHI
jgi:hypothetical protein